MYARNTLIALTLVLTAVSMSVPRAEANVLTRCTAVELLHRAGISRSLISNWVCLMENESGLNTALMTGPKAASSYSYGIFQISSGKWCARGRKGGVCNARCEDFLDNNLQDDISCAKKIYNAEGFKAWPGWRNKCKNKSLFNIGQCRRR